MIWSVVFVVLMILIPVLYFARPERSVIPPLILLWICVLILGVYLFGGYGNRAVIVL